MEGRTALQFQCYPSIIDEQASVCLDCVKRTGKKDGKAKECRRTRGGRELKMKG